MSEVGQGVVDSRSIVAKYHYSLPLKLVVGIGGMPRFRDFCASLHVTNLVRNCNIIM